MCNMEKAREHLSREVAALLNIEPWRVSTVQEGDRLVTTILDVHVGTKNTDKRIRVNFTDSNGAESVETAAGGDIWFCLPECVPAVGDSVMCVRPYLVVDKTWHSPDQCTIHLGYNIYT